MVFTWGGGTSVYVGGGGALSPDAATEDDPPPHTGCFFAWIGVVGCFFFGRTCDRWVVRNKQMEISLLLREKMALTSFFIFGVQSVICILFE